MVGTFSTGLLKAGLERGGEGAINERRVSSLEGRSAESVPTDLRAPEKGKAPVASMILRRVRP